MERNEVYIAETLSQQYEKEFVANLQTERRARALGRGYVSYVATTRQEANHLEQSDFVGRHHRSPTTVAEADRFEEIFGYYPVGATGL